VLISKKRSNGRSIRIISTEVTMKSLHKLAIASLIIATPSLAVSQGKAAPKAPHPAPPVVMGKSARVPAALVRGIDIGVAAPGRGADLVRAPDEDLFREGTMEP